MNTMNTTSFLRKSNFQFLTQREITYHPFRLTHKSVTMASSHLTTCTTDFTSWQRQAFWKGKKKLNLNSV